MNIKMQRVECFSITPPGATKPTILTVESKWNGLTELRTPKGEKIIVALPGDEPFGRMFSTLLGTKSEDFEAHVVLASPNVMAWITGAPVADRAEGVQP